ncbi:MAG: tetratricopeptide repeat protein [Candidatus Aminicenantes bacterium]|nr:tetratricopeptide repeat protein [Candidatus Aminicenantes bacterium]
MKSKSAVLIFLMAALLAACAQSQRSLTAQREKDPQYQYEKAVVCMNAGLTDYAFPYLNQALVLAPRHYQSLNLLGLAHMIKGNLPAAVAALEKCVAIAPDFSDGHNNLATALQESGQIEKAEAEYRKAFALDENYNASFNLAKIEFQRNNPEAALEYAAKSLRKNAKSLLAFNLQGLILESLNRLDEATASYEAAMKLVPGELNVEFNLAIVYTKKEDFARARSMLTSIQRRLRERTPAQAGDAELKKRVDETLKRIENR